MEELVIIIGGGPAGAAAGCYLSKEGIPNLILESAVHPREHVGESMVTATTRIFEELNFLEVMEQEGFIHKYGASWHPAKAGASLHVEFSEIEQEGVNQDYTYQVDRAKMDMLLLKHAEKMGSKVIQGVRVKEVVFENDKATGVIVNIAGQTVTIPCKAILDASGRHTVIGKQLKIKEADQNFNQFAVHAWFEGVDRGNRPNDIHIHFLPVERGWVWQIPISDTITSIGVVTDKKVFKGAKEDYEAWFNEMSQGAPDIAKALKNAKRVNKIKVEADYSYKMDSFVGNGWMLIGDAARFVDPIFSSGVSIAMHSAKFAVEQLIKALKVDDVSSKMLKPYEDRVKLGTEIWYEFITLYYRLLPIFTVFISKQEYRLQVIQLLQGNVYDRASAPVLDAMREFIDTVENTEGHILKPYLDSSLSNIENTPAPHLAIT